MVLEACSFPVNCSCHQNRYGGIPLDASEPKSVFLTKQTSMARVPYNKLLTNQLESTAKYWPSVVFVLTSLCLVRTATTSGQYCPVRPSRSVSKRVILIIINQIFLLARDRSKHVTWPNIPQLKLGDIREYPPIFKTDFKYSSLDINVRMAERFAAVTCRGRN